MANQRRHFVAGLAATQVGTTQAGDMQAGLMWGARIYAVIVILAHLLAYILIPLLS